MKRLMGDQDNIGKNLRSTIQAFTPAVRYIFESFEFHLQVDKLDKAGLLYMVCERFAQIDVLEALKDCCRPIQPLVAGRELLRKHGDSPFWRTVKAEAIPLLEGCRFP